MLETGKDCLVCNEKKFIKDINLETRVCNKCQKDIDEKDAIDQFNKAYLWRGGDKSINRCDCGRYFKVRDFRKTECHLCQNKKVIEGGMQVRTEQKNKLKREGQPIVSVEEERKWLKQISEEEKKDTTTMKIIVSGNLQGEDLAKEISKKIEKESVKKWNETERVTMQNKESIITKQEKEDSKSLERVESEETHSTGILNLSSNLRQENSDSMSMLRESAKLLNLTAKSLLTSDKGDFGDEPIKKPTIQEAEMALKMALGANEIMKTKLDYVKEGRNLINNLYELIEEQE